MMFGIVVVLCISVSCIQARGSVWTYDVNDIHKAGYTTFPNYLYKDSYVAVSILCDSRSSTTKVMVHWVLQQMHCMENMMNLNSQYSLAVLNYATSHISPPKDGIPLLDLPLNESRSHDKVIFQSGSMQTFSCGEKRIIEPKDESWESYNTGYVYLDTNNDEKYLTAGMEAISRTDVKNTTLTNRVASTWANGMYHFLITVTPMNVTSHIKAKIHIEMGGNYGYMPANMWPMLPYSAVMSVVYLILGTAWLILWCKAAHHTLKIHLVIGAITVAGALCNTLLFVNMQSLNSKGQIIEAVLWIIELLTVVQDCLTHLLFMVVSTGYGITRPTLNLELLSIMFTLTGISFVSAVGVTLFMDEKLQLKYTFPIMSLVVLILYGVILLCIGAFIVFMSFNTLLHLWKRKHASNKLTVYIAYVVASCVAFIISIIMISFSNGFYTTCRTDWQHEWLYINFGHMENCLLLTVLMWLWKPVDTWQTYAFLPVETNELEEEADVSNDETDIKSEKIKLEMEPL